MGSRKFFLHFTDFLGDLHSLQVVFRVPRVVREVVLEVKKMFSWCGDGEKFWR